MKTKKLLFGFSTLMLVGSLALTSCKKKDKETPNSDTEQGSAVDNNTAEGISNDMVNIGSQASENGGTSLTTYKMSSANSDAGFTSISSATITFNGPAKQFTVDFGTTPAMCLDGKMRSGKLFYDFSQSAPGATAYRMPGFKFTVTSSNYMVDGYAITINNKTVTNTTPAGFNPSTTNLTWSISASLSIVKPSNAGTISWNATRVITLLNTNDPTCYVDQSTPIHWNKAKIQVSGNSSGTNATNESFTAVSNNLVRDFGGCALGGRYPFISGTMDYTPGTRYTRHIDFGTGTCDNTATLTINGNSVTFNF